MSNIFNNDIFPKTLLKNNESTQKWTNEKLLRVQLKQNFLMKLKITGAKYIFVTLRSLPPAHRVPMK